jgi:hypothetical protein
MKSLVSIVIQRMLLSIGLLTALLPASAAEMVIERSALQQALTEQLFTDQGRYWLLRGGCPAYLTDHQVQLVSGRLQIRAKLVGKLGVDLGNDCIGVDVNPVLTVSGLPVGQGSEIVLTKISIDRVEHEMAEVIKPVLQRALPRAISFDLKPTIQQGLDEAKAQGWSLSLENFAFDQLIVLENAIVASMNLKLRAR